MRRALLLPLLLLAAALPAPLAASTSTTLIADAGTSVIAYDGAPLPLRGAAHFGAGGYTFQWSGAPGIADPAAAVTTLPTTGLPKGDLVLTLTVRDADGAVATDTVRHRIESSVSLLDRRAAIPVALPEERAGLAPVELNTVHAFTVAPGTARLVATLDWTSAAPSDMDLVLVAPNGARYEAIDGRPLALTVADPVGGAWSAQARPVTGVLVTFHLVVRANAPSVLPVPLALTNTFGALETQALSISATRGTPPYTFVWDADGDGHHETVGPSVTTARPPGLHAVSARVLDAAGYEVAAPVQVEVLDAERIVRVVCGGDPARLAAMEFSESGGTCWMHGGHHTYFLGDHVHAFRGARGIAFSVEQAFAPPREGEPDPQVVLRTPLHVETSLDGRSWTVAGEATYRLVESVDAVLGGGRQYVQVEGLDTGAPFRFFRIHEPRSALEGLSGYLDHTELMLFVDDLGPAPAPALAPGERALSCAAGDILEDFFDAHPCTFGGVDRWDSPSFFHTYVLGDGARVASVRGTVTVLPWRLDDWFAPIPLSDPAAVAAVGIRVQTSLDGMAWTTRATVPVAYGAPAAIDLAWPDVETRFVRLVPTPHPRFDDHARFAPNHHPNGFLVDSTLVVTGQLPPA